MVWISWLSYFCTWSCTSRSGEMCETSCQIWVLNLNPKARKVLEQMSWFDFLKHKSIMSMAMNNRLTLVFLDAFGVFQCNRTVSYRQIICINHTCVQYLASSLQSIWPSFPQGSKASNRFMVRLTCYNQRTNYMYIEVILGIVGMSYLHYWLWLSCDTQLYRDEWVEDANISDDSCVNRQFCHTREGPLRSVRHDVHTSYVAWA